MKKTLFIFASTFALLCSGAFVSCSDNEDVPAEGAGPVTLVPTKLQILANGIDEVKFTVTKGTDITSKAEVWKVGDGKEEIVSDMRFTTKETGTYKFEARYTTTEGEKLVSPQITITSTEVPKEVFFRRIFTQQFTSVNCTYCPTLTSALEGLGESKEWGERMVHVTFHTHFQGDDPMHTDLVALYYKQFKISGYPACVLDMMPKTYVMKEKNQIVSNMQQQLVEYPATCGVAIESKYNADTRKVDITVKVKASQTNEYRLTGFLMEDGIIWRQNSNTLYEHNNTFRAAFSELLNGDKLGTINAGSEVTKTYSLPIADDWKTKNMRVAVCVLSLTNDEYYGNNSAVCPLDGSIDYKYNEE